MENKHSPEPWHALPHGHIVDDSGNTICQMHNNVDRDYNNREANEKILKAAPDMLKTLQRVAKHYRHLYERDPQSVMGVEAELWGLVEESIRKTTS